MAEHLKVGEPHRAGSSPDVQRRVAELLEAVESGGEPALRRISRELDSWDPPTFRLEPGQVEAGAALVEPELRRHIDEAARRIRAFAEAQRATLLPLELELEPGVVLGHRHEPVASVGAYIPGGRYRLVSSALMSVLTAKVAGVPRVVAASPADPVHGLHPPTLYALQVAGVDEVLAIGGVAAMAALALGVLSDVEAVDLLVGAGNAYVAEAKRQLFGRVGIDLLAGPTEILVIADETARPELVAIDLLSQAEHGPTSPAVLVTTSRRLGAAVLAEVDRAFAERPAVASARAAWERHGAVVVADDVAEAIALSDAFAPEHLELQVADPAPYLAGLRSYGTVFVGEATTVTFGDKGIGTNHTLPTAGAARFTGGLWVGSFLRTQTFQRLDAAAGARLAAPAAAISRAEGMDAHALSADVRADLDAFPRLP
jgi:sulfopropanediol 3-dehydrogenase